MPGAPVLCDSALNARPTQYGVTGDWSKSADSRILSYSVLIRRNDRRKTNQRGIIPRNSSSRLPSGRSFLLRPAGFGDERMKISGNQAGNRIPLENGPPPLAVRAAAVPSVSLFIELSELPPRDRFPCCARKFFWNEVPRTCSR